MKNFIIAIIAMMSAISSFASAYDRDSVYEQDSSILYGKLDNGLQYYIYPCIRPAFKANFYLLNNVGSVLEKDSEQGMAHFIEHMAYNGSLHFPGRSMVSELEKFGILFGYDINAFTGQDATVYRICGIDTRLGEGAIDTCLLALKDISCKLTLSDEEIEKERSIILEEWRQGNDASRRLMHALFPVLYGNDNPYTRLPIGTPETVAKFKSKDLRNFYEKWYQPQHQAIIVVGNIDPEEIEAKIIDLWERVKPKTTKSERPWAKIDNHNGISAAVITDPEFGGSQIDLWFKVDIPPRDKRNTLGYINDSFCGFLAEYTLKQRLSDIMFKASSPWSTANSEFAQFYGADSMDAFRIYALYDRANRDRALEALITETKRFVAHGITPSELEMAKQYIRSIADNIHQEFDEKNTYDQFQRISDNMLVGNVVLSVDDDYNSYLNFTDTVTTQAINAFISTNITPDNLVAVMVENSAASDIPSNSEFKSEILRLWGTVDTDQIEENDAYLRPLIPFEIKPGKIEEWEVDTMFDARHYRLSNGARVVVCKRDVLTDEIALRAVKRGGDSALLDSGFVEGYYASNLADIGGVGDFSVIDLDRKMVGKMVDVGSRFTAYAEIIEGSSRVSELEELLQVLYLRMTTVRRDYDAIANWKKTTKGHIADMSAIPSTELADSVFSLLYGKDHRYIRKVNMTDIDTLNVDRALDLYASRIANPAAFDYIIVGNIDFEAIEPLIEKYIGSLPGNGYSPREPFHRVDRLAREGVRSVRFIKPMPSPVTSVYRVYEIHRPYTIADEMTLKALGVILEKLYIQSLRTESGGTYTPRVDYSSGEVDGFHSLFFTFDTNPDAAQMLLDDAESILRDIAENGPDGDTYENVTAYLAHQEYVQTLQQEFPLRFFTHLMLYEDDDYLQRYPLIYNVTAEDVQAMAKAMIEAPVQVSIIMEGQEP